MRTNIRNSMLRLADAEANDYYATEPRAVELLLEQENFSERIWEPCCGEGHISKVLDAHGHIVRSTDLIDRGFGAGGQDFLNSPTVVWNGDIITNPPYKYAKEFVERALDVVAHGCKVAMLLRLTFLEGQSRRDLFRENPPQTVYVSSARLQCAKNGNFEGKSMVAYAWFVWHKGHYGPTHIKWIN